MHRKLLFDLVEEPVGSDDDRAWLSPEELQAEEDSQFEALSQAAEGFLSSPSDQLFRSEQKLLDEMGEVAEDSRSLPDARVLRLVNWIREQMCPGLPPLGQPAAQPAPQWNDTRLLIFTEYVDTMGYLKRQLEAAIEGSDRAELRIETFHGQSDLGMERREHIKRAFNADPAKHPLRILIATDAAREGINLQTHCWNLFHFDVPWNPARMEQRNGRIDRKLQPRDEVFCHYFFYRQRPEDRILEALVKKTEMIHKELGSLSRVIESRLSQSLHNGILRSGMDRLKRQIEQADLEDQMRRTVEEELEEARQRQQKLRQEVEYLRRRLQQAKKWIQFDEDHFRSAISSALQLMGADPLQRLNGESHHLPRYRFPALDQRAGADPSWASTLDTLREPRRPDQKPWEWRREAPIRPVVFRAPETMDDEVVHLHLEHRVAQRLLGRFAAQGFVHHDLVRACALASHDPIPRLVLLGRLSLFGAGAARHHEELVAVTARWFYPAQRAQPLQPYARDAESHTLGLLEESLRPHSNPEMPSTVVKQLLEASGQDVEELLPHLKERCRQAEQTAAAQLAQRGEKEAADMAAILQDQQRRIAATVERFSSPQMKLEFDQADAQERRQLEANQRHWQKRLAALGEELDKEPRRICDFYRVQARRVEPVGLVYLWPRSG